MATGLAADRPGTPRPLPAFPLLSSILSRFSGVGYAEPDSSAVGKPHGGQQGTCSPSRPRGSNSPGRRGLISGFCVGDPRGRGAAPQVPALAPAGVPGEGPGRGTSWQVTRTRRSLISGLLAGTGQGGAPRPCSHPLAAPHPGAPAGRPRRRDPRGPLDAEAAAGRELWGQVGSVL